MENPDLIESIAKYTGIIGLVVFFVFTLFRGIIQKNIFSSMTKEQSYNILKLIIRSALFIAIVGVGAWAFTQIQSNKKAQAAQLINKTIEGYVEDLNGMPIKDVTVYLKSNPNYSRRSDSRGYYYLDLSGNGEHRYEVMLKHPNFLDELIIQRVNYATEEKVVAIDKISMTPKEESEITNVPRRKPIPSNNSNSTNEPNNNSTTNTGGTTDINLLYNDEGTGCNLQIQISIGGLVYTPTTNPVDLLDVKKGYQTYSVSGIAYCGGGQCQISGQGQLKIIDDGQYYLVFDPNFTCVATILSEADYNQLMDAVY